MKHLYALPLLLASLVQVAFLPSAQADLDLGTIRDLSRYVKPEYAHLSPAHGFAAARELEAMRLQGGNDFGTHAAVRRLLALLFPSPAHVFALTSHRTDLTYQLTQHSIGVIQRFLAVEAQSLRDDQVLISALRKNLTRTIYQS